MRKIAKEDLAAAYYIRAQRENDPLDFLRAWKVAHETPSETAPFNRALILETLGLHKEAIRAWDGVAKNDVTEWGHEARSRRDRLIRLPNREWRADKVSDALRRRDRIALAKMVRDLPFDAVLAFEESDLLDVEASRMFAEAIGEPYALRIVNAVEHTADRRSLEQGLKAFRRARERQREIDRAGAIAAYDQAAELLERADNPLALAARYGAAGQRFSVGDNPLPLLDLLIPLVADAGSASLTARIHTLRANGMEYEDRYLEAHPAYQLALESANKEPTATAAALARRSLNYARIGSLGPAFADSYRAVSLLPAVADLNARHQVYSSAADAARQLGYPQIALLYQNAAVDTIQHAVLNATPGGLATAQIHYAIALRARADILVVLERDQDAKNDLQQAFGLVPRAERYAALTDQLRLRLDEVNGQALLNRDPRAAVQAFTEAIALATEQDSTYRAVLHFKRAAARRKAGDERAEEDITIALTILEDEASRLRDRSRRGEYERLWTPYFSRFQAMYHQLIESRIEDNDIEGAFVETERARAFEPMQLLLQSDSMPAGFRKIDSVETLRQHRQALPPDTLILQYLILDDKTYTWVLTRDRMQLIPQRARREDVARWVSEAKDAVATGRPDLFDGAMRAAYTELFQAPLELPDATNRTRIVIIPDGPLHGMPFAGLHGTKGQRYLLQRGSIAVAGSTSLYLYSLLRDRQLASRAEPAVLVVGDPANPRRKSLRYARAEAEQLGRDYPGATVLLGPNATTRTFLQSAKNATIVHFAGHGIPSPQQPWSSMLLLTPDGTDSGELTAERLMSELAPLTKTRLVVLGACSTAAGDLVGPEGVAPLVRPLIASNVPAVVSTLWDVQDATAMKLLVSLHCHYRNGDDVAVALQQAQLEMLRRKTPATTWAAFQVVGHAGSPFDHGVGMEKRHSEHLCSENSLHRPDGLHSQ